MKRANVEGWNDLRKQAVSKSVEKAQQKTAEAISDNAAIAQRIKAKLLKRLEKEIDALPEKIGSESTGSKIVYEKGKKGEDGKTKPSSKTISSQTYKLRDLTAAYKDLTDDMNLTNESEPVRIVIDV